MALLIQVKGLEFGLDLSYTDVKIWRSGALASHLISPKARSDYEYWYGDQSRCVGARQ
jgi:hypothetical protein